MIWDILFDRFFLFLLFFCRIIGVFSFNPIFSRKNAPPMAWIGLSGAIALIMTSATEPPPGLIPEALLPTILLFLKEGSIGFVLGFMVQMFMSMLAVAGEAIDMQIGLGMAKIMDPSTGVQSSLYASGYTYLFILYFFAINGHLTFLELFRSTYDVLPLTGWTINLNAGYAIASFFSAVLIFAVKFAMPVLSAQLLVEVGMGLLMKAVPNIQVLVVNIQVKLISGMLMMFLLAGPMAEFLDRYLGLMFENLFSIIPLLGGG